MDTPEQQVETTLPAARTSARDARRFIDRTLRAWSVPSEPRDTACLLTTELVTNAVLHAGSPVGLALKGWDHRLRVEVSDRSDTIPTLRAAHTAVGTTGRGLTLVKGFSHKWGVTPHPPGKSVWFELEVGDPS